MVRLCRFHDCSCRLCRKKMFHGLAGRRTLYGFLGALLDLDGVLWLTGRLVLEIE